MDTSIPVPGRQVADAVPVGGRHAQVEDVVEHAEQAAAKAARLPSHVRAAALDHAAAELERRAEEFAGDIAREGISLLTGGPSP